MQQGDLVACKFRGDDKKYFADVSKVEPDAFECRFVHSGNRYKFDTHSFTVLETTGAFPKGTPLTWYALYEKANGALAPLSYAVVTFGDGNRYLGVVNYLTPDVNVTFLHSGSTYTFSKDNTVVSQIGGAYPVGHKVKSIEAYRSLKEVQLSGPPSPSPDLAERMKKIKTIVPTGEGEIVYVDGKVLGSVLMSNFDVNSAAVKVEYHKGLEQLSNAMNGAPGAKAVIIGRASQTGPENWNEPLSEQRARNVADYLTGVEKVSAAKIIDTIGAGSQYPLRDNRGIEDQLNRSVQIFFFIPMVLPPPPPPPPPKPPQVGTRKWAIQVLPNISVGAAVAGTFLAGKIRNRDTGEERPGAYIGGGIGASLKYMPKVGGVSDDWEDFTTDEPYVMDDFDGTLCRYTTLGVGILVGYSASYISFPNLGANSISVGGFELGSFGAGGTTTAGIWKFT